MQKLNRDIGNFGEELAVKYLSNNGYFIMARNFRCRLGELDIIAKDKGYIAFIEVKTRYNDYYGSPGEAVNYQKQTRIYRAAQTFISTNRLENNNFRFDVVEILIKLQNNKYNLKLIKNAFQL